MARTVIALLLFVVACLLAGLYGMLHNQISYTVSPEYFTKFKFQQFNVPAGIPDRIGAAIVGWNASWWMGIVIGIFLIPFGLLIRGSRAYLFGMLKVFCVVLATTIALGLVSLAIAFVTIDSDATGTVSRYNNEMADAAAFLRAGAMHNSSYAGGLVGIFTGGFTVIRIFLKGEAKSESETTDNNVDSQPAV